MPTTKLADLLRIELDAMQFHPGGDSTTGGGGQKAVRFGGDLRAIGRGSEAPAGRRRPKDRPAPAAPAGDPARESRMKETRRAAERR
jgi:hypothetical protein